MPWIQLENTLVPLKKACNKYCNGFYCALPMFPGVQAYMPARYFLSETYAGKLTATQQKQSAVQ